MTSGYVSDGANESFEGDGNASFTPPTYLRTTAQGNNVGWESGGADIDERDMDNGIDRRLAGCHISFNPTPQNYRIDLPSAGDYTVRIAAGREGYTFSVNVELFDGTTSLGVLASGTGATFADATNVDRTAAAWPGSNVAVTRTFATTICRFKNASASAAGALAHVYVESAAPATTPITVNTLTVDSLAGGEIV